MIATSGFTAALEAELPETAALATLLRSAPTFMCAAAAACWSADSECTIVFTVAGFVWMLFTGAELVGDCGWPR